MTAPAALPLDDPAWGSLSHAYGSADDVPGLLRALEASPRPTIDYQDEPWFTLWSSLCHQGDVYTASYAAVPNIVRIALEADWPIDFSFLMLPTAIEIARGEERAPLVPDFLEAAYRAAIEALVDCVLRHSGQEWDNSFVRSGLAAMAVAKGHRSIAEAIIDLDDDWIARIRNEERD